MIDKYLVAGLCFSIEGEKLPLTLRGMMSFQIFKTEETARPVFRIIERELDSAPQKSDLLYKLFADEAWIHFYSVPGGHLLELTKEEEITRVWHLGGDIYYAGSCEIQLLRFALWVAYGFGSMPLGRIAVHSSCIVSDDKAYLFLGESGTGKSTHTKLWRENIPGAKLLNDDSPIIAVEPEGVYAYGSPWSGKTPCYHQKRFPLGGAVRLSQAPYNKIQRLSVLRAFAALHPSCPPEFSQDYLYDDISSTLSSVLKSVPVWHLECLPDAAAAHLSHDTITNC